LDTERGGTDANKQDGARQVIQLNPADLHLWDWAPRPRPRPAGSYLRGRIVASERRVGGIFAANMLFQPLQPRTGV